MARRNVLTLALVVAAPCLVAGCDLGGGGGGESAVEKADFIAEFAQTFDEDAEPLGRAGLSADAGKTRVA